MVTLKLIEENQDLALSTGLTLFRIRRKNQADTVILYFLDVHFGIPKFHKSSLPFSV
jgi:hypothetical protein